jgi:hypothetical protein
MADARDRIEPWRKECNDGRPYTALGRLTPNTPANQVFNARTLA